MCIPAKAEVDCAVVTQDGAVDRHLASDWNIRIAMQHLVAVQIERKLRPRHICADHVEGREGYLADHRPCQSLHRGGKHPDQASS